MSAAPTRLCSVVLCAALLLLPAATRGAQAPAASREPAGYPAMRRELRIGADVMRAALAENLPESLRVARVEAGYLVDQGVLVLVELTRPWLRLQDGRVRIDPDTARLEDIPDMIHDILAELDLGLTRHQQEELEELRAIRESARAVRAEQRALRAELRERRRALLRVEDAETAATVGADIERLRAELEALNQEELELEREADALRREITDGTPAEESQDGVEPATVDDAVARAVCGYGATFRSLPADQRLDLVVREAELTRYYVFRMDRVRACQEGNIDAQALLRQAYRYQS